MLVSIWACNNSEITTDVFLTYLLPWNLENKIDLHVWTKDCKTEMKIELSTPEFLIVVDIKINGIMYCKKHYFKSAIRYTKIR